MVIFLELLLLQISTGYAFTFPGGNLGTGSSHHAYQPSSPPPSPPTQAPFKQRICHDDDRVDGLIQLVKTQHEEQMQLLRTLAKCQCSGQQDNDVEYQEYIPQEEEPYQEVPEFPVPAPYEVTAQVPAPYEVPVPYAVPTPYAIPAPPPAVPYEDGDRMEEGYAQFPTCSGDCPTFPPAVSTSSKPSEVPTARKYQTQSTTQDYTTTAPPPTRSRYQGPLTTTTAPPVPTARKYQTESTTLVYTTTAPPPTRSRYQSPPTTTIPPPAPTARKYQTQPTTTTTAPPPTSLTNQRLPTTTIPPPAPTAQRYQYDSLDMIPEEYDESRSYSIFPECDGDCPTIPYANLIPQQYSYEEVSTSHETEPSTTEYNEPSPVPEQGSDLGNYRTNPRGFFSAVSPVPLPHESYHVDLEEIVKELEENYPPKHQRTTTTPAPSYRGSGQHSGQWNYLPGYGNIKQ